MQIFPNKARAEKSIIFITICNYFILLFVIIILSVLHRINTFVDNIVIMNTYENYIIARSRAIPAVWHSTIKVLMILIA